MKLFYSTLILLFISFISSAQDLKYCGTTEKQKQLFANDPTLVIYQDQFRSYIREWISNHQSETRDEQIYIIPVVFHVIHDYGNENISDAQVEDAVRILNEDFRKLNSDTSQIVDAFKNVAGDSKIEFRLANKAPDGSCTSGIEHIHSLHTYSGDDNAKLSDWPRNEYLNIWTVLTLDDGIAGYAYLPSYAPVNVDGVIILSSYVGSIGTGTKFTSRALTHEVGHTMGLAHTWGYTNAPGVDCGDDDIDDTPITEGWTSCNLNGDICTPGVIENVQNYMEYAYCSRMFTKDQGIEMQGLLNSNASDRNNLSTLSNLITTGTDDTIRTLCAPVADFYSSSKMTCKGGQVVFYDVSSNGTVESRTWTFQDGSPATATDKIDTVMFESPGWKTVTLTVTNAAGTNSVTQTNCIYVTDATAQHSPGFFEGFEDPNSFSNEWLVFNPEGNGSTFTRTSNTGFNSSSCVKLNNYNNMPGDRDQLVSPSYDLSGSDPVYLNFRYAGASNSSSAPDDILSVYTSVDCGEFWLIRTSIMKTNLASAGNYSSSFTPTSSSQWGSKSMLIPSFLHQPNVRFMFEYRTKGTGNNFYLDDVNVSNYPVGIDDPDASSFGINIFPNPVTDNSVAIINQHTSAVVSVKIFDMEGRIVSVLHDGLLTEGEHHFDMNAKNLRGAGMYLLVADDGTTIQRQKFIVQ